MKTVLKTIIVLGCGIIGGYLLLVMVFCLPLGRIHNNILESSASFDGEYKVLVNDNITTKLDDYTDALMLLTAEDNNDRNPFTGSIFAYHFSRKDTFPNKLITDLGNPENVHSQYSRYWHGYLLFLKPLLLFFNYSQIQILISFVAIGLVIGVSYCLQKRKLSKYIIPYGITVAVMFLPAISLSIQYISVFAILNLAIICILLFSKQLEKNLNYFYFFLVVGMLTCYFDLLTFPVVTLGLPLVVWLIVLNQKKTLGFAENLKQIIVNGIAWGIGYFGIWVGKWLLGSVITRQNLINSAMEAASTRASTTTAIEEISRLSAIKGAIIEVFSAPVIFICIIILIALLILLATKKLRFEKEKALSNLWMLIIGLIPIAWYIVLANHSLWHLFFTYRTITVLVFAIGCYITSTITSVNHDDKKKRKEKNG